MTELKKCKGKGEKFHCDAKPIKNEDYCFFHSPNNVEQRKEASSKGGQATKGLNLEAERIEVRNEEDVLNLLVENINNLRQGKISSKTANAIGYLALQALPLAKEVAHQKDNAEWFRKHPGQKIRIDSLS